jgi:IS30 family transposase
MFENDKAFASHKLVAKSLAVKTLFTRTYSNQHKETVKNRIGHVQRFFPRKKISSTSISCACSTRSTITEQQTRKKI